MCLQVIIWGKISAFCQNILKNKYSVTNSLFFKKKIFKKRNFCFKKLPNSTFLWKSGEVFYFHISNIAKFGKLYLWMIATSAKSQNWKEKKKAPDWNPKNSIHLQVFDFSFKFLAKSRQVTQNDYRLWSLNLCPFCQKSEPRWSLIDVWWWR